MDRVATSTSFQSALSNLMRAQVKQADAQAQVSSGKLATDLRGFGASSESITAARTLQTRAEGYIDGAKALSAKLDMQALAFSQLEDAAGGVRQAVANAVANGRADGMMAALGSYLGQATQALNTQHNGQYLFGGGADTPPVSADQLSDLTAAPTTASLFGNAQLLPMQALDDSTTVRTGFLASEVGAGLFDALRQIQAFNEGPNGPFGTTLTPAQETFLTGLFQTLDGVRSKVTETAAENGLIQNRVEDTQTSQESRRDMLEGLLSDLSEVDIAEAATRLAQAQTAVQASAQVFATLKDVSLLELLR
ncbi:MAG: flagellin [Caulobacteraceae bacterium]